MKKIFLSFLAVFGLSASMNVYANDTATLFLEGYVELISQLIITPQIGAATTLDVVGGESARRIATVAETTNNTNGYEIYIESQNAGLLQNSGATQSTAYAIIYDGGTPTQPAAVGTPTLVKTFTGSVTGSTTNVSNVDINVTANANLNAGAYTDTLIITMTAL